MKLCHVFIVDNTLEYSTYLDFIPDSCYQDTLEMMETPLHNDEVKLCVL